MRTLPKFLLLLALGIGGWLWWRGGKAESFANLPPTARGEWVALGDSLTEGVGAGDGHGFPAVLGQRLGMKIRNLGVSGNTTAEGLARLDQALALQPRVVLLCFGGNDSLRGMAPERTFGNLGQMIDRFHQAGSFVVLLGVRSVGVRDKHADPFEKLARAKRVLLVPNILEGVLFSPKMMSDTIHPNDQGYAHIAGRIEQVLLRVKPQL